MKLNSKTIGLILIIMVFGGIGISKLNGSWMTEGSKIPKKFQQGEYIGKYNPEDIRGSYTLKNVEDSFEIEVEILAKAFGVEEFKDIDNFQLKNLETIFAQLKDSGKEIGTGSVRMFVALYKGLPYEIVGDDYLPEPAVEILKDNAELSNEQINYLNNHSISINDIALSDEVILADSDEEHEELENENVIKGSTTFKDVLDMGIQEEIVEEIIGYSILSTGSIVRDFCIEKGLSFGEIKVQLQEEVEKK